MNLRRLLSPLLLMVMIALVMLWAMWAGLIRLGWALPSLLPGVVANHGPLMISGVIGTLIALERAVALSALRKSRFLWMYAAPLLSGAGGVLLTLLPSGILPKVLILAGSLGLVAMCAVMFYRHQAVYTAVMGIGALGWAVGNFLWLAGWPVYAVVHIWAAFLILTIVSERLELGRIIRLSHQIQHLFVGAVGLFTAGVLLTTISLNLGVRLVGLGEIALAVWLLRYDIARFTVQRQGLPRFIAVCLLAGYVWLGMGGAIGLIFGDVRAGVQYDALLHALFLGFVISMIFGHAPIIIPALTGKPVVFRPTAYLYLLLLHASLVLRIGSELAGFMASRQWGGVLNVTAILIFMGSTAWGFLASPKTVFPNSIYDAFTDK
ncbi:MAG: hypothetical protein ABI690_16560 [Chloroflexota bacterium]